MVGLSLSRSFESLPAELRFGSVLKILFHAFFMAFGAHLAVYKPMSSQDARNWMDETPQLDDLRAAIRTNRVSFPVPVPVFARQYRADVQWRLVELYLIHGWSPVRLAERYKISCTRVRQSVRSWVRRAKTLGYLQPVPLETEDPGILAPHLN